MEYYIQFTNKLSKEEREYVFSINFGYQTVQKTIANNRPDYVSFKLMYHGGKYGQDRKTNNPVVGFRTLQDLMKWLWGMFPSPNIIEIIQESYEAKQELEKLKANIANQPKNEASHMYKDSDGKDGYMTINPRFMACITKSGKLDVCWYTPGTASTGEDFSNGHTCLAHIQEQRLHNNGDSIDWNYTRFGGFYSFLHGNGAKILVIYGSSCDYPVSSLDEKELTLYKSEFNKLAESLGHTLIWNI